MTAISRKRVLVPRPTVSGSPRWEWWESSASGPLGHRVTEDVPRVQGDPTTIVVVPCVAVSWHRLEIPVELAQGGRRRLLMAVAGLIEDLVLDEVDQLIFSVHRIDAQAGMYWVSAMSRAWLLPQLKALEDAGHTVTDIVPEMAPFCIEPEPAERVVWLIEDDDRRFYLWSDRDGVHLLPAHQPTERLLPAWEIREESTWLPGPGAGRNDRAGDGIRGRAARVFLTSSRGMSLAQFELSRGGAVFSSWKERLRLWVFAPEWRLNRRLLVSLLLIQLIGLNLTAWKARHELAAYTAAIQQELMSAFPETRLVIDPLVQMSRSTERLRQASGGVAVRDFEPMMSALGGAPAFTSLHSAASGRIRIDYVADELHLRLQSPDPVHVEALKRQLSEVGYRLDAEGGVLRVHSLSGNGSP